MSLVYIFFSFLLGFFLDFFFLGKMKLIQLGECQARLNVDVDVDESPFLLCLSFVFCLFRLVSSARLTPSGLHI